MDDMDNISRTPSVQTFYKVGSDEYDYVERAIKAGTPIGQVELVMVLAEILEKKPLEIQQKWMDHRVGVQQVIREIR